MLNASLHLYVKVVFRRKELDFSRFFIVMKQQIWVCFFYEYRKIYLHSKLESAFKKTFIFIKYRALNSQKVQNRMKNMMLGDFLLRSKCFAVV